MWFLLEMCACIISYLQTKLYAMTYGQQYAQCYVQRNPISLVVPLSLVHTREWKAANVH